MTKPFVWPEDGSLQTDTVYTRYEDMSPDGSLSLMVQEDGDVILTVQEGDTIDTYRRASVEFCMPCFGGGQSPNVRNALLHLIRAIQEDNKERPLGKRYCR